METWRWWRSWLERAKKKQAGLKVDNLMCMRSRHRRAWLHRAVTLAGDRPARPRRGCSTPCLPLFCTTEVLFFPLLFPSSNLQSSWMNRNKLSLLFVDEEVVWLTSRLSTQIFAPDYWRSLGLIKLSQTRYIHPRWPRFTDFLVKYVLKIHHYICGYHLKLNMQLWHTPSVPK